MDETHVESTMTGPPRSLVGTIRDGKWRGERREGRPQISIGAGSSLKIVGA